MRRALPLHPDTRRRYIAGTLSSARASSPRGFAGVRESREEEEGPQAIRAEWERFGVGGGPLGEASGGGGGGGVGGGGIGAHREA